MKASGMIELLIIVVSLVAGLPLFIACNTMANKGLNLTYMDDKSTWDVAADIEWKVNDKGVLVPDSTLEAVTISAAQAAVMPYIQDEYTPNTARSMDYNYQATWFTDPLIGPDAFNVATKDNQRATRYAENNVAKKVVPIDQIQTAADRDALNKMDRRKMYLIWNYDRRTWMLTEQYFNIYQIS